MDKIEVLKVSVAALLHDIGKFIQGAEKLPKEYEEKNSQIYLPFNKKENRFTHKHALWTVYFIENFLEEISSRFDRNSLSGESSDDTFINLAGKHHIPETPLQWIIAEADRLSSGFDREEFLEGERVSPQKVYETRLVSIFERLLRKDKSFSSAEDFEWEYPLLPLGAENIFPVKKRPEQNNREDYRNLWQEFKENLSFIKWEDLELWARAFDSYLRVYTSQIPSARVGMVIPDVSLYDHCKTTASLAGALYLYHKYEKVFEVKDIKNEEEPKFLLISGDFYGIQDFIFRSGGEERHHRAKILRGRSFMVSLLSDLCAEFICDALGISFLQVFFSAAGKFHILAPNLRNFKERLNQIKERIVLWFKDKFYLEAGIGIVATEASPRDFRKVEFKKLWEKHLKNLEEAKYKRFNLSKFGGRIKGYLDRFRIDEKPVCPLCGKRPSELRPDNKRDYYACRICEDQIYMGTHLVKTQSLAVLKGSEGDLKEPLLGIYQIKFLFSEDPFAEKSLLKIIDFNVDENGKVPAGNVFLPLNGYVPVYVKEDVQDERIFQSKSEEKKLELINGIKEKAPKSFYHIAKKALRIEEGRIFGIDALGVFKADVDNLGAIFSCGLPENLFTISRLCTMSRKLHEFFALYLPYALKNEENGKFKEIYTVFAGGDDLFLIGPWNVMQDFGLFLIKKFKKFVSFNPEIHFSAGITFHKPDVPVEQIARESEEALEKSKKEGKNRVTMFGVTADWQEFEELKEVNKKFKIWFENGWFTKSSFYKLNSIIFMLKELGEYQEKGYLPMDKLYLARWRALVYYFLSRNLPKELSSQEKEAIILECCELLSRFGEKLVIPLWSFLYEIRETKV